MVQKHGCRTVEATIEDKQNPSESVTLSPSPNIPSEAGRRRSYISAPLPWQVSIGGIMLFVDHHFQGHIQSPLASGLQPTYTGHLYTEFSSAHSESTTITIGTSQSNAA